MNTYSVGARQIKAARALLDWSQDDLAHATKLSIATIRKLEIGCLSPRLTTTHVLRLAFEEAGVEFIDADGVRRRQTDVKIYQGAQSGQQFIGDLLAAVKRPECDLCVAVPSSQSLVSWFGSDAGSFLETVVAKLDIRSVKIILVDTTDLPFSAPGIEYRSLSSNYVNPMPFCVCGDRYALLAASDNRDEKIVVVRSSVAAKTARIHFESMWGKAICSAVSLSDRRSDRLGLQRVSG